MEERVRTVQFGPKSGADRERCKNQSREHLSQDLCGNPSDKKKD